MFPNRRPPQGGLASLIPPSTIPNTGGPLQPQNPIGRPPQMPPVGNWVSSLPQNGGPPPIHTPNPGTGIGYGTKPAGWWEDPANQTRPMPMPHPHTGGPLPPMLPPGQPTNALPGNPGNPVAPGVGGGWSMNRPMNQGMNNGMHRGRGRPFPMMPGNPGREFRG